MLEKAVEAFKCRNIEEARIKPSAVHESYRLRADEAPKGCRALSVIGMLKDATAEALVNTCSSPKALPSNVNSAKQTLLYTLRAPA